MKEPELKKKKSEIQELGLGAISEYFKIDVNKIDRSLINFIHSKAKLAMQFEREINLDNRSIERNYLRVFRLVADDKKELKKLIQGSLPQYFKKKD